MTRAGEIRSDVHQPVAQGKGQQRQWQTATVVTAAPSNTDGGNKSRTSDTPIILSFPTPLSMLPSTTACELNPTHYAPCCWCRTKRTSPRRAPSACPRFPHGAIDRCWSTCPDGSDHLVGVPCAPRGVGLIFTGPRKGEIEQYGWKTATGRGEEAASINKRPPRQRQ